MHLHEAIRHLSQQIEEMSAEGITQENRALFRSRATSHDTNRHQHQYIKALPQTKKNTTPHAPTSHLTINET